MPLRYAYLAAVLAGLALILTAPQRTAAAEGEGPLGLPEARAALGEGKPEEVYLSWSALQPGEHPAGDAPVTRVLVLASRKAMDQKDAALSMGLAEVALRLAPRSPEASLRMAEAARALTLPGAAAATLDESLEAHPKHGELLFQRADLAEEEGEKALAIALLERIPGKHPRRAEAKLRLARLRLPRNDGEAVASARPAGSEAGSRPPAGPGAVPILVGDRVVTTRPEETGVAGMAARKSDNFRIVYSSAGKDFGARARYEAKVMGMFEDAHRRLVRLLDFEPGRVFEVVLYTREEFELHFGGRFATGVLGFYQGKIRMNHSEDLSERYFSTVVHELTHAFLDSLCDDAGGRLATWFNEGFAEWAEWEITKDGDRGVRGDRSLRQMRKLARQVPLARLRSGPISQLGNYTTAGYLKSRAAVSVLIGTGGGIRRFGQICADVRSGRDFDLALREAYGDSIVDGLEEDANEVLSR
ncbi:MAG: hypothetical protein P1V51_14365 [Deltaproteobacteria bacterium]|nr:hypothetical protein [Deltaproteobacteria bacterium]